MRSLKLCPPYSFYRFSVRVPSVALERFELQSCSDCDWRKRIADVSATIGALVVSQTKKAQPCPLQDMKLWNSSVVNTALFCLQAGSRPVAIYSISGAPRQQLDGSGNVIALWYEVNTDKNSEIAKREIVIPCACGYAGSHNCMIHGPAWIRAPTFALAKGAIKRAAEFLCPACNLTPYTFRRGHLLAMAKLAEGMAGLTPKMLLKEDEVRMHR